MRVGKAMCWSYDDDLGYWIFCQRRCAGGCLQQKITLWLHPKCSDVSASERGERDIRCHRKQTQTKSLFKEMHVCLFCRKALAINRQIAVGHRVGNKLILHDLSLPSHLHRIRAKSPFFNRSPPSLFSQYSEAHTSKCSKMSLFCQAGISPGQSSICNNRNRLADDRLRQSPDRLSGLFNAASAPLLLVDSGGRPGEAGTVI